MGFSLRNWLEEATAQVNPFDKGQTAKTIRTDRQVQAARTRNINNQFNSAQWKDYQRKANERNVQNLKSGNINNDQYQRQFQNILGNGAPIKQEPIGTADSSPY